MLFELALPGLCLAETLRCLTGAVTGRRSPRPPFAFRALRGRMERKEIALLARFAPERGARVVLSRFEGMRPGGGRIRQRIWRPDWRQGAPLAQRSLNGASPIRVLLLHGWNADRRMVMPLAEALAGAGIAVIVPDLPGEGDNHAERLSFAEKAQRLARAYEGQSFDAVIAHSAGALVAALAIEAGLDSKGLVTVCGHLSMAKMLQGYLRVSGASPDLLAPLLSWYGRRDGEDPRQVGPRVYRRFPGRLLVVHASRDWQVPPAEAHEIAALAASRPLILDRCNHHSILSDQRLQGAVVAFLSRNANQKSAV